MGNPGLDDMNDGWDMTNCMIPKKESLYVRANWRRPGAMPHFAMGSCLPIWLDTVETHL